MDCRELQWWFAIPQLGDRTMYAAYDCDTGELDLVRQVVSTVPATTHGQEAVELVIEERPATDGGAGMIYRFSCVLDDERSRWLGVTVETAEGSWTSTAGDAGFESEWGAVGPRRLVDERRYVRQPDGSYRMTGAGGLGAGVYTVSVGENSFTCLRVLDLTVADESEEIAEAFVEPSGRTILYRQYRGRGLDPDWAAWREAHRGNELVVDGAMFLLRDCTGKAHHTLSASAFDADLANAKRSG